MRTHRKRLQVFIPLSALFAATSWFIFPCHLLAQEMGGPAKLTYSKTLKGSVPEFQVITIEADGLGTYEGRKLDEPPNPCRLQISPTTTRQLFDLASQLNNFRSITLESRKKVANLGLKVLTYQEGGQEGRVEFNYTQNRMAQELVDLFERIASVEQHIAILEYASKYDHLSLPRELLQIQIDLDNKALVEPDLMVPVLEKIVRDPHFLHLAQARAQNILQRIQTVN